MSALISVPQLCEQMGSGSLILLDVRHHLLDHALGARLYEEAHIPGAFFVPVEAVLTGQKDAHSGRHPLPEKADFIAFLQSIGVRPDQPIVVYDADNSMFAARLWWMLRWVGCTQVKVLDGGFAAWLRAEGACASGVPPVALSKSSGSVQDWTASSLTQQVDYDFMRAEHQNPDYTLIDARAADRFAGQNETIDPVGGHISGAVNFPFMRQLQPNGQFLPTQELKALWEAFFQAHSSQSLICSCGSGVTACHLLLGLYEAGYTQAALYPGSWSQWCSYPDAPVAC